MATWSPGLSSGAVCWPWASGAPNKAATSATILNFNFIDTESVSLVDDQNVNYYSLGPLKRTVWVLALIEGRATPQRFSVPIQMPVALTFKAGELFALSHLRIHQKGLAGRSTRATLICKFNFICANTS